MTRTVAPLAPNGAERVRTACARSATAVLASSDLDPAPVSFFHLRDCGDIVIALPANSQLTQRITDTRREALPTVLELSDHTPLPLRETVRSLVWLRGTTHAVAPEAQRALAAEVSGDRPDEILLDVGESLTLVRLKLMNAVIADSSGAESVTLESLLTARPDPFWAIESHWLSHLHTDHPDVINRLSYHLPARLRAGSVYPLALDRYGVTLRVQLPDSDQDVRLPFSAPAGDFQGLSRALRLLMGCPFRNGLQPRR